MFATALLALVGCLSVINALFYVKDKRSIAVMIHVLAGFLFLLAAIMNYFTYVR